MCWNICIGYGQHIYLYVHLDDSLPNQRSSEKGPKRDQEVTTGDPSQVKQRVGDL